MRSPAAPRVGSADTWNKLSSPALAASTVANFRFPYRCVKVAGEAVLRFRTTAPTPGGRLLSGLALGPSAAQAGGSGRYAMSVPAARDGASDVVTTEAPALPPTQHDILADQVVSGLKAAGVRCVAFDMDCTAVDRHSRGRLRRSKFDWFVGHVTPAFKTLVPKLCDAGIHVAMATASDKAEYRPYAPLGRTAPHTHMLGEDLVVPLLHEAVPEHADRFCIVCYNPRARGAEGARPENHGKEYHIREICSHFDIPPASVLLLDDEERNHAAHLRERSLFTSIKVDARHGLQLPKLASQIKKMGPQVRIVEL